MAFLRLHTSDGHLMAEVYSCLQKYVRRGDLHNSLYWAHQIAVGSDTTTGQKTKGYPNALRRRLMQHALEDVGHLGFALELLKLKPKDITWDSLRPWIAVLCGLPKTRAAAWFNRVCVEHVNEPASAPSIAIKRGAEALQWHADGNQESLKNHFPPDVLRLYKELGKEVLALHAHILTDEGIIEHVELPVRPADVPYIPPLVTPTVPDWALDKHTARGKALGRGYQHFFDTMVVAPRLVGGDVDLFEAEARSLYLSGTEQRVRHVLAEKRTSGLPAFLSAYTDVLQAQLLTGAHKPRVWFATRDGVQWVIKGPVKTAERQACLESQKWKERLGLPHPSLVADGDFLVSRCLFDYSVLETQKVSSKIETNVEVPVLKSLHAWRDNLLGSDNADTWSLAIMETLLFRKLIGTNDTCHRNILVIGDKVYSVDDPALKKPTPRMWKMSMRTEIYGAALSRVWDRLLETMDRWAPLVAEDAWMSEQLRQLRDQRAWVW